MHCCLTTLQEKEVINLSDGARLGHVGDIEIDSCCGKVVAIVIFGKAKFCGFGGREKDLKILWEQIEVIGEETILVRCESVCPCRDGGEHKKKTPLEGLFR